jgi:hypothetical protein
MKISDIAVTSYGYVNFTEYADSYNSFQDKVGGSCDLTRADHRKALLDWLNQWGCRQFSRDYRRVASKQILLWYADWGERLPPARKSLLSLSEVELGTANEAFEALSSKTASIRKAVGKKHAVRVGSTGASKILFAIRPKALAAWDDAMRKGLKKEGLAADYLGFLMLVQADMNSLKKECKHNGIRLSKLPDRICRPEATLPQLISEYYWAKYARRVRIPDRDTIKLISDWAR